VVDDVPGHDAHRELGWPLRILVIAEQVLGQEGALTRPRRARRNAQSRPRGVHPFGFAYVVDHLVAIAPATTRTLHEFRGRAGHDGIEVAPTLSQHGDVRKVILRGSAKIVPWP
jgi:hypothetical protein